MSHPESKKSSLSSETAHPALRLSRKHHQESRRSTVCLGGCCVCTTIGICAANVTLAVVFGLNDLFIVAGMFGMGAVVSIVVFCLSLVRHENPPGFCKNARSRRRSAGVWSVPVQQPDDVLWEYVDRPQTMFLCFSLFTEFFFCFPFVCNILSVHVLCVVLNLLFAEKNGGKSK